MGDGLGLAAVSAVQPFAVSWSTGVVMPPIMHDHT